MRDCRDGIDIKTVEHRLWKITRRYATQTKIQETDIQEQVTQAAAQSS
jgi:hypothetical protein